MSARYSSLDKYKYLNTWDKYNTTSVGRSYDGNTMTHVINAAGPNQVYHRPGYATHMVDNGRPVSASYKINQDDNPLHVVKQTNPVTHRQNVRVRYLEPPAPPKHAPIVIKERMLTPPPPPPPLVIKQRPITPPTPPPLIIREKAPAEPQVARSVTFIEKILPPPPAPARQVIIERIPNPPKPRDLIYEKWLPYRQPDDRQVIVERGKIYAQHPQPKNVIIDHEIPNISVDQQVYNEGTFRADPSRNHYIDGRTRNAELQVVDKIYDLPSHTVQMTNQSRPSTPKYYLQKLELVRSKTQVPTMSKELPKTAMGPYNYAGPWNTTYRSSYTGKRVN